MSADLLSRLIEAGTPAALVAEVAMLAARADAAGEAMEQRRAVERERTARYRSRGGGDIPGWLRREVFERDSFTCVDCGAEDRLECDHVIPLARGGPTSIENLQTLCKPCNARKRDRIRKADVRGQSRTNEDTCGSDGLNGTGADEPSPTPSPSSSPDPSNNPTPAPTRRGTPARTRGAAAWPCPDGVNPDHWRDLQANRRAKRMPLTATALDHQLRQLAKLSDDEWPPGRLVEHAAAHGWAVIHDPRQTENRNGKRSHPHRSGNGFLDACLEPEYAGRA